MQPAVDLASAVSTTPANGLSVTPRSYSSSSNLYSCGGMPSETCVQVLAFTGNGKPSTTQIRLTCPPVFHVTSTDSKSPALVLTVSRDVGLTCSPPMLAIFPQEGARKSFGPSFESGCAVANDESQTIDVLNASR